MQQNNQNRISNWLEALILSVISANKDGDYAYGITCKLEKMNLSVSTVYPICKRLKEKNWLSDYDKSCEGRNRRYYKVTAIGKKVLIQYQAEWYRYRKFIEEWLFK